MALGFDGIIRIGTKINSKGFSAGISSMGAALKKLAGVVGLAFGTVAIVNFGREAVKAASDLQGSLIGLQSIVEGQGRSFQQAQSFVQDYIKDGLVPMQSAVTAYKNLAMRGYSTEQIETTLAALKDAAAFGRQASLSMGEAVTSATEGLKNENSILVDNAGVTKNVSVMWKEYADSIGVGVQSLTQQQKIQAEVNGILNETRFQTGDAAKVANTYAGQVAMLSFNFQQLKVAVGNAIMPVVKAVLPGINAIISALTRLANVFAQVTALLFGKELSGQASEQKQVAASGNAAASATDKLADATAGAGSASKKAAKDMRGVLAGFDDLNVLARQATDSVDGAAGGMGDLDGISGGGLDLSGAETGGELFGDVTVNPEIAAFIERLQEALEPTAAVFARLREEMKRVGGFAWQGLRGFYDNFLKPVGAWALSEDGLPRFVNLVADTLANIDWGRLVASLDGLWTQLSNLEIFRGQSLIDFYAYFLKPLTEWTFNEAIPRLVDALANGLAKVDYEKIRRAWQDLWKALEPFAEKIGEGLLWFWENVLVPLGTWTMNEVVPRFLEILRNGIETLTKIIDSFKPAAEFLWEHFLKPLAEYVGESFLQFLDLLANNMDILVPLIMGVATAWGVFEAAITGAKLAMELFNLIANANPLGLLITAIGLVIGALIALVTHWDKVKEVALLVWEKIKEVWGNVAAWFSEKVIEPVKAFFSDLWSNITDLASKAWDTISSVWGTVKDWFSSSLIEPLKGLFSSLWDGVKQGASSAWDGVKSAWGAVSGWFSSSVLQPLTTAFSTLWNGVASWASNAWKSITDVFGKAASWFKSTLIDPVTGAFKNFFNGVLGFAEKFVNFFIRGLNKMIEGVNRISFDVPDFLGGGHVGFHLRTIGQLNLPRLAEGAVIPPNHQFAAILGDQRSGVNIETPLSTMIQAFKTALSEGGYGGGELHITMPVYLDSREIYQGQKRVTWQNGKNLVGGLV